MATTIKFCGGTRAVTGSMHLISANKSKVLLDVGLFQGHRQEFFRVNSDFPFNPQALHCCVISHAHIDHCGNFPTLVKQGFRAKAYLTPSTRDLCNYMLADSGHIQEEDIKYVNKIHKKKGLAPGYPLYDQNDARRALRYLRPLEYHRKLKIAPNVELTFYDAGHILGSSVPAIEICSKQGVIKIVYAVDLGRPNLPYLRNPEVPKDIDYLIIESTYGARTRPNINTVEESLSTVVNRTIKRGGKVIVPSFALERAQEVLYFLSRLLRKSKIRSVPIYLDSPLAVNITEVFKNSWEYFDSETRALFKNHLDPFSQKNITYVSNVNRSKKLNEQKGPMIIISAAGTCEHGRILHHLKNNIEDPRNTVVIVGYMPRDTLGRKIVERRKTVNIFGQPHQLKAEVAVIDAFSAHADKFDLLRYVQECNGRLKKVFIVHGEAEQSEELRENIKALDIKAVLPKKNEVATLLL